MTPRVGGPMLPSPTQQLGLLLALTALAVAALARAL